MLTAHSTIILGPKNKASTHEMFFFCTSEIVSCCFQNDDFESNMKSTGSNSSKHVC